MKFAAPSAILCLAFAVVPAANAGEFHRHTTIYGPAGMSTGYTDRTCYNGMCTYDHQATGPNGYSVSRSATTTEVAPGVYERNVTRTGPRGATANRSSAIIVNR